MFDNCISFLSNSVVLPRKIVNAVQKRNPSRLKRLFISENEYVADWKHARNPFVFMTQAEKTL